MILLSLAAAVLGAHAEERAVWKPVQLAILRLNEDAPKSWNIYHGDKHGLLLVQLWKRYLLVKVSEQEVYEVDPQKVRKQGENVEWSPSEVPAEPIETSEWKVRDVGPVERVRFRLGKTGHFLDMQLPLERNGKPRY